MAEERDYDKKKAFFDRVLTVYGRKAVLEALGDDSLQWHALHLARSNRESGIVSDIRRHAETRGVPVKLHTREELARISRNGKQDQGVALDVICPAFKPFDEYLATGFPAPHARLLALDGISNPQNLGMIIRSAAAGAIDGIIVASKGNAALGPLVIKASAGTVYRAPLLSCSSLSDALRSARNQGGEICILTAEAPVSLFKYRPRGPCVYVLGNETDGVSKEARAMANTTLCIPMGNGVESLNVAVTASLIAYSGYLER